MKRIKCLYCNEQYPRPNSEFCSNSCIEKAKERFFNGEGSRYTKPKDDTVVIRRKTIKKLTKRCSLCLNYHDRENSEFCSDTCAENSMK